MNRRVLTLIVGGLAFAGCSHSRSSIRDIPRGSELPPSSASELPPIQRSADAGDVPSDPTRPAIKTWSRGVSNTTRGQSPEPLDPIEQTVTPDNAEPVDPAPAAACGPQSAPADPIAQPPADQMRASELKSQISPGHLLGITMASVGGEAITSNEVQAQFNDFVRENVPAGQHIPREDAEILIHRTLEQIIDRTVVVQEAKRTFLKKDNQKKMFEQFCEKQWAEHELPPMFRKNKVTNVLDLHKKLAEQGDSLDERRLRFQREFMAREFLNMRLQSRLKPTLPEMREYYAAHRQDFHRKAMVGWREIFVKGRTAKSREKAVALLDRLRRGESLDTIAKAESDGPTAAKGGKWETGLGASATPGVNAALETLGLNQTSGIIEGKRGYHIIRIDERQLEGPAPFSVVQDKVYTVLFNQNFQREMESYVKKLRSQTIITYWINGNAPAPANGERIPEPKDPQALRTSAEAAKNP